MPESRLEDCQEEALREGRGVIIQGVLYTKREDVPEKWFLRENPAREEARERRQELAGIRKAVLEKKAVDELQTLAGSLSLSPDGPKADLVARILAAEGHETPAAAPAAPAAAKGAGA